MISFVSDLRFALRAYARQPGATALVVLTLGLAVAANTAVFTLLDGVFFRPFPFPEPNRLVYLNEKAPRWNLQYTGINYPDFTTWRARARTFVAMAVWSDHSANIAGGLATGNGGVERVEAPHVTYDLPTVLRIKPVLGRSFTRDEDRPNGPNVTVISWSLWQSRFGGSPSVIGKTLRVNSLPYTVIGVLPREGEFPDGAKLWLPFDVDSTDRDHGYSYDGVGRLKPGVTLEQAQKDLIEAHRPVWLSHDTARAVSPLVMPLRNRYVEGYVAIGKALGAGVVLVLLIACANVAGAMLARAIFRRREIGIRVALGANGGRVARQLLTESLALSALAGVLGVAAGESGLRLLVGSNAELIPHWASLAVGPRTVLFSVAVVTLTALLFGLAPALQLRRTDVRDALTAAGARSTGAPRERGMLSALVVGEVGLAVVLLVGGGLLMRAYQMLRRMDPGFRAPGVVLFRIALPDVTYGDGSKQLAFYRTLLERLQRLPSVDHAGMISCPPFGCHWGQFYRAEGDAPLAHNEVDPVTLFRFATTDYFATMGIHLVRGRFFRDDEGGARHGFRPAVVNEEFVREHWANAADPVGKRFMVRGDTGSDWFTVVGVVKDVKHYGLTTKMIPGVYFAITGIDSASSFNSFAFAVHTTSPENPSALFPAIRTTVRALDPELPVYQLTTLQGALDKSLTQARMVAFALAAFAAIALTLAVGGIYATLSYVAGRRRQEIGIRMALGAESRQVLRMVVRQGLRLVATGVVIGLPAALLSARVLSTLLAGVSPNDPLTYGTVVLVLAVTTVIAAGIPARRAARVEPRIALGEA